MTNYLRQEYECKICGDMGLIPVIEWSMKIPYTQNYACECAAGDRVHIGNRYKWDETKKKMEPYRVVFFERFFGKFEDDGIGLDQRVAANHEIVRRAREAGKVA